VSVKRSLHKLRRPDWVARGLPPIYAVGFWWMPILQYDAIRTEPPHLAPFDQVTWNMAYGRPFETTLMHHGIVESHLSASVAFYPRQCLPRHQPPARSRDSRHPVRRSDDPTVPFSPWIDPSSGTARASCVGWTATTNCWPNSVADGVRRFRLPECRHKTPSFGMHTT
jgi:hypothetical protein